MSLATFDLVTVFACSVELAQATKDYRPTDFPNVTTEGPDRFNDEGEIWSDEGGVVAARLQWHRALDAIVVSSNRLKRALGATGPLDVSDQLRDKTEPAWEGLQNKFKYCSHSQGVRHALWKLANAAVDLTGYATVREPDAKLRERGLSLLGQGLSQLWANLSGDEREAVRPLLPRSSAALGWSPNPEGEPPIHDINGKSAGVVNMEGRIAPVVNIEREFGEVVDIRGGFATRPADFFKQKAAALEVPVPMVFFQLVSIFDPAVKYAVVIWDKKSEVTSDRDPFDCVPDFPEIGVARFHLSVALGIPNRTIEGWKEEVRKAELSDLARQALVHLNKAVEWERLPRDDVGNRQPGSLATSFGLLQKGLQELYLAMSPPDQARVKHLVPLIRERWEKDFPSSKDSNGRKGTRKKPIPKGEANVMIREYLKKVPAATIQEIKEATEVSTGAISQSAAWKAHQAAKIIRKGQTGRQVKTIQLTDKMLKAMGQSNDSGVAMSPEEAAWRKLLEDASPDERGRLNKMNSTERAQRIQAVLDQVTDQVKSERKPHGS
jgi:hypothetical protein